jgi:hypothetical protein
MQFARTPEATARQPLVEKVPARFDSTGYFCRASRRTGILDSPVKGRSLPENTWRMNSLTESMICITSGCPFTYLKSGSSGNSQAPISDLASASKDFDFDGEGQTKYG